MSTIDVNLRDYFAATASDGDIEALQSSVPYVGGKMGTAADGQKTWQPPHSPTNWRQIARYMHADLMLKERQP